MGLRYRIPLPGPFYYSGHVGLPRSGSSGCGPMGLIVKYFVVYPGIVMFGAGLAIVVAPFYGLFWVVRRWRRNRWGRQPATPCFPVQRPVPQCPAASPVSRSHGFVLDGRPVRHPVQRQVQSVPYGFITSQRGVPAPAYSSSPGIPRG